jgi:D-alanine-D-alanine ligase
LIDQENFLEKVEDMFGYPLIAKPVDDGCSSAVKVIRNRSQLQAYCELLFSINPEQEADQRRQLNISNKEEFSHKTEVLFEQLIRQDEGIHFLEITGGLLTHYDGKGGLRYEMFEPSETLAGGEILSLEEKFLAGEGQNLTPARFAVGPFSYAHILPQVQHTLERAARILKVEGYCRIDAFVRIHADGKAETQVIEVNSLPGMTPATAIFHQAALAGYKPAAFIQKIIAFGFERQARKKSSVQTIKEVASLADTTAVAAVVPDATTVPIDLSSQKESFTSMSVPSSPSSPPNTSNSSATLVQRLSGFATFLRSKYFLKNLASMLGLIVISFLLLNVFLNVYTSHGNSVQVENYVDLGIDEASKKAKSRGFKVSVNQAPFTISKPQGQVIAQEPEALKRIKKNRTIYLTIIGSPKEVGIPSFEAAADNYSRYRQNLVPLQVKCAVKESVFDAKYADSTILHFYYQGRKYSPTDVKRGVQVLQGSTLEFVVTKSKDDYVRTPALKCKRFSEVNFLLPGLDLRVGEVLGDVTDKANAYVYEQEPAYTPGAKILRGESIKIYLQDELPAGCPTEIETNAPPSESGGLDALDNDNTTAPIDTSGGF